MLLSYLERAAICEAARSFKGVPWVHLGRLGMCTSLGGNPAGLDCLGMLIVAGKQVSLVDQDFDKVDYVPQVDWKRLVKGLDKYLERIVPSQGEPGDILLYGAGGIIPVHLGILADRADGHRAVIQASVQKRKVIEHRLTGADDRAILAAYRYKGRIA